MNEEQKIARLAEIGTATVYEASGRQGLIDLPLIQVVPRSRVAGKARTVLCGAFCAVATCSCGVAKAGTGDGSASPAAASLK